MTRLFKRMHKKAAMSPGTVEYVGEKKTENVLIHLLAYDGTALSEKDIASAADCVSYRESSQVSWIDITGLHDTDFLQELGELYNLHPLMLEDIVNAHQRPKLEDYEDYVYIVLKMLYFNEEDNMISAEQISIVLGQHYVLTFQERPGDVFEPVRDRLRKDKGRIRKLGPDYLAYALIDAIVDNYFGILEKFGEQIEALEDPLLEHPTPDLLENVHEIKREMILIRKSIYPLREVAASLERGESRLIKKSTSVYFRDVYDHTIQVIDAVESF
ncbi:MAG: magnesium and cobalt transport protein CorA, partial [Candidatus Latescibacterota bacterium]